MTRNLPRLIVAVLVAGGVLVVPGLAAASGQRPAAPAAAGAWASAREVAGGLNAGSAAVTSVSCASPGNCAAGGYYETKAEQELPFLDGEVGGTWQPAVRVPGITALDVGLNASLVSAVSCPSAGNCTAVGVYSDAANAQQVFVTSQAGGSWSQAEEIPGTAALNAGGQANVFALSCRAATSCTGGGTYSDSSSTAQALVITEASGIWTAKKVAGSLNVGGGAQVSAVSCSSAGNCAGGGYYSGKNGFGQAFVVTQTAGSWGAAKEVPGTGKLNALNATVSAISCASAGNCTAGGNYGDSAGAYRAFVVTESAGTWGTAKEAPGTGTLNRDGSAMVTAVSCRSAGNCSAGGYYADASGHTQAFVITQVKGTWSSAKQVAGRLNRGDAAVASLSCGSVGNCTAGGYYHDAAGQQAFEVGQSSGTWGSAAEVRGTGTLNAGGGAGISSISCPAPGVCGAGGYYNDKNSHQQAFVVNEG